MYWPENDPQCGPGLYRLTNIFLPLTSENDGDTATVVLKLFVADPVTLQPVGPALSTVSTTFILLSDPTGSYKISVLTGTFFDTLVSQV
jgi:hypothetical protein